MRWLIAALLSLTALAGCAEDPTNQPLNSDEEAFSEFEGDVSDTTGLIRGLVLDPAIVPVAGVTVTIQGLGLETVTNEDGAFLFGDLDAGTYFLEAKKLGYLSVQQSVLVEAGVERPDIVKFQLIEDLANQPLISSYQYDGFMQCSFTLVVVGFNACGLASIVDMPLDNPLVVHDIAPNGTFAQTEMVWRSTQALGDQLQLMYSWGECDTFYCDKEVEGTSPLVLSANGDELDTYLSDPANPNTPGLMIRVFGTESSAAQGSGVGATIDQSFTHYTHVFYAFTPDEGWLFIEDGAYPLPS
ncbi:MAG: carboxypeptidase-like regulatory domain-containing protein [Thermoplasmatota archaeon]